MDERKKPEKKLISILICTLKRDDLKRDEGSNCLSDLHFKMFVSNIYTLNYGL